jgi:hypothetical protein
MVSPCSAVELPSLSESEMFQIELCIDMVLKVGFKGGDARSCAAF